jgi:hypothetical protein
VAMLLCVVRQAHHEGSGLIARNGNSATSAIVVATLYLPHGELVEPRTAVLSSGNSAPLDKNNRGYLSTLCKPRLFYSSPFHGNCFRSRSKWGEDRRLRWRVTGPLSGEVLSKGSPAGTMTGACWTSTVRAPDLAGRDRIFILQRRASTTARLPNHSIARRKSGRGKGDP